MMTNAKPRWRAWGGDCAGNTNWGWRIYIPGWQAEVRHLPGGLFKARVWASGDPVPRMDVTGGNDDVELRRNVMAWIGGAA
jgi:hypothetical protein